MLVVISDLHFTDGTTSNWKGQTDQFNVNPKAFQLLFGTVCSLVRRRDTKIDKVTFVYNGDIFDPLRTYEWFAIAEAHRPWAAYRFDTHLVDEYWVLRTAGLSPL